MFRWINNHEIKISSGISKRTLEGLANKYISAIKTSCPDIIKELTSSSFTSLSNHNMQQLKQQASMYVNAKLFFNCFIHNP